MGNNKRYIYLILLFIIIFTRFIPIKTTLISSTDGICINKNKTSVHDNEIIKTYGFPKSFVFHMNYYNTCKKEYKEIVAIIIEKNNMMLNIFSLLLINILFILFVSQVLHIIKKDGRKGSGRELGTDDDKESH
ncbi:MAG: hypothetical protein WCX65_19740 [bacterium]